MLTRAVFQFFFRYFPGISVFLVFFLQGKNEISGKNYKKSEKHSSLRSTLKSRPSGGEESSAINHTWYLIQSCACRLHRAKDKGLTNHHYHHPRKGPLECPNVSLTSYVACARGLQHTRYIVYMTYSIYGEKCEAYTESTTFFSWHCRRAEYKHDRLRSTVDSAEGCGRLVLTTVLLYQKLNFNINILLSEGSLSRPDLPENASFPCSVLALTLTLTFLTLRKKSSAQNRKTIPGSTTVGTKHSIYTL